MHTGRKHYIQTELTDLSNIQTAVSLLQHLHVVESRQQALGATINIIETRLETLCNDHSTTKPILVFLGTTNTENTRVEILCNSPILCQPAAL